MKQLWCVCLLVVGCGAITEPEVSVKCPDGYELWHWSRMDTLGVLTEKDICLPGGTAEALFERDSTGGH